ncbi:MAG: hypothetical protein IKF51_00275, partial [Solobacterium sp.]|nr:hypothetical protein [Solobacterium sp.]
GQIFCANLKAAEKSPQQVSYALIQNPILNNAVRSCHTDGFDLAARLYLVVFLSSGIAQFLRQLF